jgi:hypothetical protein
MFLFLFDRTKYSDGKEGYNNWRREPEQNSHHNRVQATV